VSLLSKKWIPDSQCGYRLFRSNVIASIPLRSSRYEMETELIVKAIRKGYGITYHPIHVMYGGYRSHIRRLVDTLRFCRIVLQLMEEG
jgi:hypothetical protein